MGKTSASYHTPGNELTGGVLKHAERVITIDDLLLTDKAIANIDEAMNHYDVRGTYSNEMGRALARTFDKHVAQMGVLASRETSTISGSEGHGDGAVIATDSTGAPSSPNYLTSGDDLADAIFLAAQVLDEKDVPEEDRYVFVRPAQFYNLVKSTKVLNRDWGGKGSYAEGTVIEVAGVKIVKTNNLPSTDVTTGVLAGPDQGNGGKYVGDFTQTAALVMHPSAVGTVKLMDLAMEMDYSVRHQATFMVAKYAMGHGILRPESAIAIENDTATNLNTNQGIASGVII